jgi:hypothetical protein
MLVCRLAICGISSVMKNPKDPQKDAEKSGSPGCFSSMVFPTVLTFNRQNENLI